MTLINISAMVAMFATHMHCVKQKLPYVNQHGSINDKYYLVSALVVAGLPLHSPLHMQSIIKVIFTYYVFQ